MIIMIKRKRVDVADAACRTRECFWLGYDNRRRDAKGQPRPVCGRRHQTGCPTNSVCPSCRVASVEQPGSRCSCLRERISMQDFNALHETST
jgi:hypothetical protein